MIEFPPDWLPANEDKAARERRVFQTFAAYASRAFGLRVIPGTIESREPPEPDIHCEIYGQGPLAFELCEILDEAAMKQVSTMMSARDALLAHRAALPPDDQIALQARFVTREVRIAFRHDRALRVIQAAIPEIYRWLLQDVDDDLHGDAVPLPRGLLDAVESVAIQSPGPPFIDIAFGFSIADATSSAAARKLCHPKYATAVPVELLLYVHDQPLFVDDAWRSRVTEMIVPLLDAAIAHGHIRRIWIFSVPERHSEQAVKFVYPELTVTQSPHK